MEGYYNSSKVYENGDIVWYADKLTEGFYTFIHERFRPGISPADTRFWRPIEIPLTQNHYGYTWQQECYRCLSSIDEEIQRIKKIILEKEEDKNESK